ncbi:MAG: amidase [Rhizobiales bacterium 65-9]|nr:amidase [Hyphomicrobiales bacterium]OJY33989.1 MAG: amidase [Rhizobiales bacterium 65-9]
MTDLHHLSAAKLASLYAKRKLSPVEATQAALARIDAWDASLNAMYLVYRDAALKAAKESEKRWRKGETLSAIDGVPITLKDNIATRGDPMPLGTAAMPLTPKTEDSPAAARTRESGAVIIGKTTMPDYGMLSSGVSSFHGITRNPWDLTRNTSGSSSGAGAAAAAGYGPLHVGTDIGGSVRLPAVHNGVFALKPSLGRIPHHPPYMGRVAGPMTRTVTDAALLMETLTRPDPRDFMSLPYDDVAYSEKLGKLKLKGLRIGLLREMGVGFKPHPEIAAAVEDCAQALVAAGADLVEMKSFMTADMLDGFGRFFEARSCNDIAPLPAETKAKITPFIVEWATWRATGFTGPELMAAYGQIMAMREAAVKAVGAFDFVISPTSPILPYEAEGAAPGNDARNAFPHIAFTVAYNMSEQPAASINWASSKQGLPLGVQVIGQRFDDRGVLRLAYAIEQLRPKQKAWPEPA